MFKVVEIFHKKDILINTLQFYIYPFDISIHLTFYEACF